MLTGVTGKHMQLSDNTITDGVPGVIPASRTVSIKEYMQFFGFDAVLASDAVATSNAGEPYPFPYFAIYRFGYLY